MSVVAIRPDYSGEMKDRVELFNGKQLLYIGWEDHLMFCAPLCIPVEPGTPFAALSGEIIPALYAQHPDVTKIEWDKVVWKRSGHPFTPDMQKSISENGLGHKAALRFCTPGLTGIQGTCT